MKQLSARFFAQDTVKVARELLGKLIFANGCLGRIVETEAYGRDPASHAFKKTERSRLMFETYGYVYVYLIYGMYECLNFTTEKERAGAVLIRAVEPLTGIGEMEKRRGTKKVENLCSGPGKLCQALGINRELNGTKLGERVKIYDDGFRVKRIRSSSRVGIKDARELQWRFFIEGNKFVSKIKLFP